MRTLLTLVTGLGLAALMGCGQPKLRDLESWLHIPVQLEVGSTITYKLTFEQRLTHGKDAESVVKSEVDLALHVVKRDGGALMIEAKRLDDGEAHDFQFQVLPNGKFSRVTGFEYPGAISAKVGEFSLETLTKPEAWLHDMLRPLPKQRFAKGETWVLHRAFDGVPFPMPVRLVARVETLETKQVRLTTKGDVDWQHFEALAQELMPWPKKSLRSNTGYAVLNRLDGLVEEAEWTLELTNDRDWTLTDGAFPASDGKRHTIRHVIRITRQ